MLYGMIGQTTYEQGSGALNFQEAFNTGFQVSDFLLCTFGDLSIAVAHVNTMYYVFDSHSRNTLGQFSEAGSSVLLQFNSMSSVVNYLNSMYGGAYFNISPVILQYDGHACINNEISACRFGFPFKPCQETRLLDNIDISSESSRGKFYELQRSRSGAYINAFNPIILEHWQANMDIQIVGNAESAAYYVCAYICKSEPEDLKSILSSVIENIPEGASQRQKMLKIGCCVLKSRRLSAQEVAYRLNNDLHLIDTSRSFIYLCTKPKSERYRILKPKYERDKLANDSTDIFYNNILDYYRSRPFELENECFYEFAQWYVKCDAPKCLHSKGRKPQERFKLLQPHHNLFMRKRTKALIVRLSRTKLHTDEYFYGLLLAFLPHRIESDILKNTDVEYDPFLHKYDSIDVGKIRSLKLVDEIENAVRFIRCTQIELAATLNPSTTEVGIENCVSDDVVLNISVPLLNSMDIDEEIPNYIHDNYSDIESSHIHNLEVNSMSIDTLNSKILKLTNCQKKVMNYIITHYKNDNFLSVPIHIFINGSGGVGKSYLIRLKNG
ncbi:unnamed protein product [Mytilus coruscus]|uniref:Uncharacterized protein n=1 Tax=Mytilus coruscus TaxID=42192 RepID=A0A6J8BL49_MYTCO|nr:unnamed protein product [Mytilus coruscus]